MGELPRSAWNALNRRIQFAPVWQAMLQAAVRLRSLGRRCPLALVIVLSAAFHLWYLAEDHVHATPDTITYVVPARNLAIGRGFVNAAGLPETFRTPGYPFFLAVLIKAGVEGLALAVQHLMVVGLAALV